MNIIRGKSLIGQKRVASAGHAACGARKPENTGRASFEQKEIKFPANLGKQFRRNQAVWRHLSTQLPYYQHFATWWIVSVKRPEPQERRFNELLKNSSAGHRLRASSPKPKQ